MSANASRLWSLMGIGIGGSTTKFWSWMPLFTLMSVKKSLVGTTSGAVLQRPVPPPPAPPAPPRPASGSWPVALVDMTEAWLPQASGASAPSTRPARRIEGCTCGGPFLGDERAWR